MVRLLVEAIRREDPKRFIVLDGIAWGRRPLKAAYGLAGVGQATRGYEPVSVSHYLAPWGGTHLAKPIWPPQIDAPAGQIGAPVGILAGTGKRELRAPLEVRDLPPCHVAARWGRVSGKVKVRFTADGRTVAEAVLDPKPGAPGWEDVKYHPQWRIHQGSFTLATEFELPAGARRFAAEVVSGDWIRVASLTFTAQDGKTAELHVSSNWARPRNFSQRFVGFDTKEKFVTTEAHYADPGREYLYQNMFLQWDEALANGTFVMAGEFGVWKMTPHKIALGVIEDYLALWKERDMSWALWNLRGDFGILDSGRADVKYENYQGHKLDRKLLELLQRY